MSAELAPTGRTGLSVEDLVVYAGATEIVRGVDLVVEPGTWCTVIGPNGAGKTTMVEAVAGLRRVRRGRVVVDGVDLLAMNERERARHVALVPQHPIVPVGMAVRDYVALGRTSYHGLLRAPSAEDRAIVERVLVELDLAHFAERDVTTLSGGERQRAVLARALAQSTMLVVLDEPITGLDLRHQITILERLRREVDECGLSVVATMHDLTLAGQFADRLVLIDDGRVVLEGPAREVIRDAELARRYDMELRVLDVDGHDVVVPIRR